MNRLQLSEIALVVGAPALLVLVELLHPQPHDLLQLNVGAWLAVHYAQILLFPLAALAVARLLPRNGGVAAAVSRMALFLFAATWTAWDAVAGVGTGLLVKAARSSSGPEEWQAAIDAIWRDPIMGGGTVSVFAVMGAVSLSVGTVCAGIALKRAGASWAPVVLLALSGFGISIFKTHAWPGGPLTFGGIALASAWLLWEKTRVVQITMPLAQSHPEGNKTPRRWRSSD